MKAFFPQKNTNPDIYVMLAGITDDHFWHNFSEFTDSLQ
jgi:hypothetical protein